MTEQPIIKYISYQVAGEMQQMQRKIQQLEKENALLREVVKAAEHIAEWGLDMSKQDGNWTNLGWKQFQTALEKFKEG